MSGKFPSCLMYIELNPQTLDVNVHPAKTEIKFSDDKKIYNAVYIAVKMALDNDLSRPVANFEMRNRGESVKQAEVFIKNENYANAQPPQTLTSTPNKENCETVIENNNSGVIKESSLVGQSEDKVIAKEQKYVISEQKNEVLLKSLENKNSFYDTLEKNFSVALQKIKEKEMERKGNATQITIPSEIEKTEQKEAITEQVNSEQSEEIESLPVDESYRIVGEIFNTYIIVEDKEGILLIDKHAAHERMIFNRISKNPDRSFAQRLLSAETVTLKPIEARTILDNASILSDFGFDIEEFGSCTVIVRSIPSYINESDISLVLSELAEKLLVGNKSRPEIYTRISEKLSCTSAIKANSITTEEERESFVKKVMSMPEVKYCPHGRPIATRLTKYQLDKQYKRRV